MCSLPPLPIVVRRCSRSAPLARPVSARCEVTSHHLALHLVLDHPHLVTCHLSRSAGDCDWVRLDVGLVAGLVVEGLGLALFSDLLFRWLPGSATWS